MRKGLAAVEESIKSSGSTATGGLGRYLSYLIVGEGESKIVRFLTDAEDLVPTKFYEFVKDKNGKYQNFVVASDLYGDDPSWRGEDWVLKYGGKTADYTTKELVDPKPRERIVGLAVEREEYPVEENGRRVMRTQDKLNNFEGKDGKAYDARNFLVVKQYKTFWQTLTSYYHEFGTLCDRDYKVTRNGTGKDITYSIIPKSPDPDWNYDGSSLDELRARYGYGTGKDMDGGDLTIDSDDRFLYCRQTLDDWLTEQASEERARDALVGGTIQPETRPAPGWATGDSDEPTASPAPAPPAANGEVSSLRARLERHR